MLSVRVCWSSEILKDGQEIYLETGDLLYFLLDDLSSPFSKVKLYIKRKFFSCMRTNACAVVTSIK